MSERHQGFYGNAELITEAQHDLTPEFSAEGSPAVTMGFDPANGSKGWAWNPATMQGHALSFGTTRSGKGTTAIIPALLTYTGSMVVIDPKGENAWTTAARRRQLGQRVVILDPWDEVNRRYAKAEPVEQVTKFNPLSALRADDPDFADDVAAIADALIIPDPGGQSHWTDSARELVAGLIAADAEGHPGKASLGRVRRQITAGNAMLVETIKVLVEGNPDSLAARKLARFLEATNEISGIRSTANTQTAILDAKRLTDAMETDDPPFDLADLATGKVTLYIVLPLDRLTTHGRWMRLILTLAIRAISRQAEPPSISVMFLLDEFGTVGALRMVETAFGLLRGVGVVVWAFLQDLSQLQRDYPQSWQTFLANTAVVQVLNARDNNTSEYFSTMTGNYSAIYLGSPVMGGAGVPDSYTPDREIQRPLLYADDIRRFPPNRGLLFYAGSQPVVTNRTTYFETPAWRGRGIYRPLPGFPERGPTPPAPPPASKPEEPAKRKGWGFSR